MSARTFTLDIAFLFEVSFHPETWGLAYRPGTPRLFPAHLRIGCLTFSWCMEKSCNDKERMT